MPAMRPALHTARTSAGLLTVSMGAQNTGSESFARKSEANAILGSFVKSQISMCKGSANRRYD